MKAIQCALKSNDAATSDFGVISLSLLSTERQWYEGHIHPQQLHSYLWCFSPHSTHLHCSASVSSCSCPRPAYSSPPAFFLNPSLSPSLKALLFSCEDLDSSGDSGFVVRKWWPSLLEQRFPQGCWRTLLKNLGDHQYSPCELQSTSCFQWKGLESPDMKMNAFGCCICSLTMTMSVCQLQVTCWPREECKQLGRWEWQ